MNDSKSVILNINYWELPNEREYEKWEYFYEENKAKYLGYKNINCEYKAINDYGKYNFNQQIDSVIKNALEKEYKKYLQEKTPYKTRFKRILNNTPKA